MIDPVLPSHTSINPVATGAHSEAYLHDQQEKYEALRTIRDVRQVSPGWNTLKEVLWAPFAATFQLNQAVGSFAGHLLFALPAGLVGGVIGVTVYAPLMKTVDYVAGRKNTRSLFQYSIKPAQVLANMVYNRVTDLFCRFFLGPTLTVAVVEPLLFIAAGTVVALVASPFIYRDFASNRARNVEHYIDYPLTASVKHFINHYFWQRLDDAATLRSEQDPPLQQMKDCLALVRQFEDEGSGSIPFTGKKLLAMAAAANCPYLDS